MLEKLFESLDEKVFTSDLKESLEAQFNEAVEVKAILLSEEKINEKIEELAVSHEEKIVALEEKTIEFMDLKEAEMLDNVDKYLERVVDEFMVEAKSSLDESLKSEKADAIIEAFDASLIACGTEVAKIVESKDNSEVSKELEESVVKYDLLIEENITLKESNDTLLREGVIAESKEGLSIIESEKFIKLAALVEFTKDDTFAEKLETIKESIKGAVKSVEKVEEIKIEENKPNGLIGSHLV
jgi:hypothetical protein